LSGTGYGAEVDVIKIRTGEECCDALQDEEKTSKPGGGFFWFLTVLLGGWFCKPAITIPLVFAPVFWLGDHSEPTPPLGFARKTACLWVVGLETTRTVPLVYLNITLLIIIIIL